MAALEHMLGLPLNLHALDNPDTLENRHLRGVGDLLLRSVRPALTQISKSTRIRLELKDEEELGSAAELIDSRPSR